jgi:SAM-dependent methyltransferase
VSEVTPDLIAEPGVHGAKLRRESRFWDEHVAPLEVCLAQFRRGPAPNSRALLDALEPLSGMKVLDLGCGAGVLSAWLAARGAEVTAVDLSGRSLARAAALFDALGLEVELIQAAFPTPLLEGRSFDRLAGRYVLHHLDLPTAAPALGALLAPGGRAAFLETMSTNPVLRLARRRLAGRYGIARHGTPDERPLRRGDLDLLSASLAPVRVVVAEVNCARLLDRQLLAYRSRHATRALGAIDRALHAAGLTGASYHQVLVMDGEPGT